MDLGMAIIQNKQARVEELLGRGADQHAFGKFEPGVYYNALHIAAWYGREQIVIMLLSKGAILEVRSRAHGTHTAVHIAGTHTAVHIAAMRDKPEVCLLLIAKGADLRYEGLNVLLHYGSWADPYKEPAPSVKAQRVAEIEAAFRAGCHPSQVQRRKDENWAKCWPLMNVATGSGFLLMAAKKAELKATALPTDAKLPPLPTRTRAQRRALRHSKVLGNVGLVELIASFIPAEAV